MNLQKQLNTKKSFVAISVILILIVGLLVVTFMPEITSWRLSIADNLLEKANATKSESKKYSYLNQANLIGFGDPIASNELAEFWIDRGEYQKAIDVYTKNVKDPNYTALGILSLKARDYEQAKQYFEIANKQMELKMKQQDLNLKVEEFEHKKQIDNKKIENEKEKIKIAREKNNSSEK